MTIHTTARANVLSMMGFAYFYFIKARYYAGLFAVPKT